MLQNVLANVRNQAAQLPVCVVETGEAEGVCSAHGYTPDLLLSGPAHPAHSRNVALRELSERDAHVVFMDEDDYYGPRYVEEHLALRERGRLVGKIVFWVQWGSSPTLTLHGACKANKFRPWLRGGTISGFAREMGEFPDMRVGEDAELCQAFLKKGGKVWCSSVSHCAYRRYDEAHGHIYAPSLGAFEAENGRPEKRGTLQDVNSSAEIVYPQVH